MTTADLPLDTAPGGLPAVLAVRYLDADGDPVTDLPATRELGVRLKRGAVAFAPTRRPDPDGVVWDEYDVPAGVLPTDDAVLPYTLRVGGPTVPSAVWLSGALVLEETEAAGSPDDAPQRAEVVVRVRDGEAVDATGAVVRGVPGPPGPPGSATGVSYDGTHIVVDTDLAGGVAFDGTHLTFSV